VLHAFATSHNRRHPWLSHVVQHSHVNYLRLQSPHLHACNMQSLHHPGMVWKPSCRFRRFVHLQLPQEFPGILQRSPKAIFNPTRWLILIYLATLEHKTSRYSLPLASNGEKGLIPSLTVQTRTSGKLRTP
jgi:hypothetical protein